MLGKVIEQATGSTYCDFVRIQVLAPLGVNEQEMGFEIPDPAQHAKGYLDRCSAMDLLMPLLTDRQFWGSYEDKWLSFKAHHLNGPAFGGLIGTAATFSRFLQDQLRDA